MIWHRAMKSCSLVIAVVWAMAGWLCGGAAFAQGPTHADVAYGPGDELVDLYLSESNSPMPVYIWGHAKGQTYKRVPKDAVALCLKAGCAFLSIEANDNNGDGIQDLYDKAPWNRALDFVIANAGKYKLDPENIFIGGRSLGSMGSFPAGMERWKDIRGIYSMQALPTGGEPHAALVQKNAPPCVLVYRDAPGSGNHDPLNGLMVQEAYKKVGLEERFQIRTETPDRQWFEGFIAFVEAFKTGGSGKMPRTAFARRPREKPAGRKPTHGDVQYGPHERNVLDFYQAESDSPAPVAVYIHGGGFRKGGKHMLHQWYADVLEDCLASGVSVAAVNYRFINSASLPEIFRDAARAIQYIRHNAEAWNVDKTRFAGFGASAGAGTSLWLASHEDLADADNADPVLRESSRLQVVGGNNCQATYDRRQAAEIAGPPPQGQARGAEGGIRGPADPDSAEAKRYRKEVNMLGLMSKDDAPVFLYNKYKNGDATNFSQYVHHPRHSFAIKEKCEKLGLDTELILKYESPNINTEKVHDRMLQFFFKHFGLKKK